jgi:hypothetical protein
VRVSVDRPCTGITTVTAARPCSPGHAPTSAGRRARSRKATARLVDHLLGGAVEVAGQPGVVLQPPGRGGRQDQVREAALAELLELVDHGLAVAGVVAGEVAEPVLREVAGGLPVLGTQRSRARSPLLTTSGRAVPGSALRTASHSSRTSRR